MRPNHAFVLSILVAAASPAFAQEDGNDTEIATDEAAEEVLVEEAVSDEPITEELAEEAPVEEVTEDAAVAEEATQEPAKETAANEVDIVEEVAAEDSLENATPDLEEVAASDPDLDVRLNEDGGVDAMVMLSDVLFEFGDATLSPDALEVLAGIADKLSDVPSMEITGHTDAIGDPEFNLVLGQRRADAVRDWLVANTAFSADAIIARGVGETDPIAPNRTEAGADNPEGRALNRRVEFTLPDAG